MKKIISLALAGCLTLAVGTSCTKNNGGTVDLSNITIPEYTSNDWIDITAYAGPCTPPKGGAVNTFTQYHFDKVDEAGFTKILALYEGNGLPGNGTPYQKIVNRSKAAEKTAITALEFCDNINARKAENGDKHRLKYFVRDWTFYGLDREMQNLGIEATRENMETVINTMFSTENPYIYYDSYGGNFTYDEPTYAELEKISWQVEFYNKALEAAGATGETMVNLYPSHVSGAGLSQGADKYYTYRDYVDEYFRIIAPQVGYVSYDFYPFMGNQYTGSAMKTQYLYNLELMATKCKESREAGNPIELRTFIQTVGDFTGLRSMDNIGDLRFQIYSALAFGSREIKYYKYIDELESGNDADWALLSYMTGEYTWLYDAAKTVNNEVHAMEEVLLNFEWEGVMYNTANEMFPNINFDYLTNPATSHPRIAKFRSTEDAFLTYMKDKDGNDGFMLLNFTDPYFHLDNEVTLQFNDAKALLMYRMGQKVIVPLNADGSYTFKLYPGEGRFIIPLK